MDGTFLEEIGALANTGDLFNGRRDRGRADNVRADNVRQEGAKVAERAGNLVDALPKAWTGNIDRFIPAVCRR